jgi:WD40 repeat protein
MVEKYDAAHPPVYTRAPVVPSLDYSPDGKLLAVAGYHEVLIVKADGSGIVARLVGMSERIESVKFSPDGKQLAVAGGLPARLGEVQIWDVASKLLLLSVTTTPRRLVARREVCLVRLRRQQRPRDRSRHGQ